MGLDLLLALLLALPRPYVGTLSKHFPSLALVFSSSKSSPLAAMRVKCDASYGVLPPFLLLSIPSFLSPCFLPLTDAKFCCWSLPLRRSHYLGGAWAPGVLMRQPQAPPHPPEAGLVGPTGSPTACLSVSPSALPQKGPVSAFAREVLTVQRRGGTEDLGGWAR